MNIFFSYGHDDNTQIVFKLKEDVEARGHHVWIDKAGIRLGDDWRGEISEAILNCNTVVAFLSKHSVRDPGVCLDEIYFAIANMSGRLATVLLEPENDVAIPSSICDIQWLDMSMWRDEKENKQDWERWYSERLQELLDFVESDRSVQFPGEIRQLCSFLSVTPADAEERRMLGNIQAVTGLQKIWKHGENIRLIQGHLSCLPPPASGKALLPRISCTTTRIYYAVFL